MEIKLSHTRLFEEAWTDQKRINAFRGGARSSKTWSILQCIAFWLITGFLGKKKYKSGSFSVVRETLPSLRATAYKDFISILHECNFYQKIDHRKTTLEFYYGGRSVDFFSTDDLNSAKLRGRQTTFFYINEANTVNFEAFNQLIMRCEKFCFLDYNPSGIENWCKTYIEGDRYKRGDVKLVVSTYKDNPYLPEEMIKEIENLKQTDYDLWQVYTLGNWVKSRNLVFETIHLVDKMPTEYKKEYFGLDFGYNDPAVLVRCVVDEDKNLYIEELFYKSKMLLREMADNILMNNVRKAYCDHDPLTIRELKSMNCRVKKAKKGKDSIRQGLGFIRSHKIHILKTSLNTIKEFRNYKYKLDEDNNPTDQPLDLNNHSVDATRYALSYAVRKTLTLR